MAKLKCGTHGLQDETFVCVHIIETLKDGEPRGFYWDVHDGAYEAICEACNDLSDEAFEKIAAGNINALCLGCFKDAASINGAELA